MKFFKTFIFATLFFVTAQLSVYANAETHDGFYFNFTLGGGYDQYVIQYSDSENEKYSGTAWMFKFKIGGAPVENFIIYAVLGGYDLEEPKLTVGSESEKLKDCTTSNTELGGGFCYYFMPENIFISADLTASQLNFVNDQADTENSSDTGWALTLSLGKEWWVSENWGLGIAIIATVGSVPAGEEVAGYNNKDDKVLHTFIGAALTATYN